MEANAYQVIINPPMADMHNNRALLVLTLQGMYITY